MKPAIITKFHPASPTRGYRISAESEGVSRIYLDYPDPASCMIGHTGAHRVAAEALAQKHGWFSDGSSLVEAELPDRRHVFSFVPAPAARPGRPPVARPHFRHCRGGSAVSAHTPGPWRVTTHHPLLIKVESKDRVICDGFAGEEANAQLIAAAPELLAVCVAIEAYDTPLGAGLLKQLREALASAKGAA